MAKKKTVRDLDVQIERLKRQVEIEELKARLKKAGKGKK